MVAPNEEERFLQHKVESELLRGMRRRTNDPRNLMCAVRGCNRKTIYSADGLFFLAPCIIEEESTYNEMLDKVIEQRGGYMCADELITTHDILQNLYDYTAQHYPFEDKKKKTMETRW